MSAHVESSKYILRVLEHDSSLIPSDFTKVKY